MAQRVTFFFHFCLLSPLKPPLCPAAFPKRSANMAEAPHEGGRQKSVAELKEYACEGMLSTSTPLAVCSRPTLQQRPFPSAATWYVRYY